MKKNVNNLKNKETGKKKQSSKDDTSRSGAAGKASASRGGTTDMDAENSVGGRGATQTGSSLKTKRNVTGSDYDGQTGA